MLVGCSEHEEERSDNEEIQPLDVCDDDEKKLIDSKGKEAPLCEKILGESPNSKKIFRQCRQLMEINDELEQILDSDDEEKETIPITCVVLLGLQSIGKTSLINVLIKSYAGFSAAGTANRCLLYY